MTYLKLGESFSLRMNVFGLFLWLILLSVFQLETSETLFPYAEIDPLKKGFLEVGDGHSIYWEECGNPSGIPILFLHGGPGLGIFPKDRRYFDPEVYKIVLFDQRGCGKSFPFASIEKNTTWDLVNDIEKLRIFLNINSWILFGGSWGSTLALIYSIMNPEKVEGLILRGIFLCRPQELKWFYQDGASNIFPDFWENFLAPIPEIQRGDLILAYYKLLSEGNKNERSIAARAWSEWEGKASRLIHDPKGISNFPPERGYSMARIETHYFAHDAFLPSEDWILDNAYKISNIPCILIQGRYDMVCPIRSCWQLQKHLKHSIMYIIPDAGHSSCEYSIKRALIDGAETFKNLEKKKKLGETLQKKIIYLDQS
jgi:proline iminopeptidase